MKNFLKQHYSLSVSDRSKTELVLFCLKDLFFRLFNMVNWLPVSSLSRAYQKEDLFYEASQINGWNMCDSYKNLNPDLNLHAFIYCIFCYPFLSTFNCAGMKYTFFIPLIEISTNLLFCGN